MASLRRTVQGWMGSLLYESLGDDPDIERSWGLLRDIVGQHVFGTDFVPVPFIQSSAYYNQLFVFIKKQSFLSAIGIRPPTYKVVGNMDYLVNRDVSSWSPQFDFSPWDVADGHNMYSEYNLRITSNQLDIDKYVEFKAVEAHVRGAQPPVPGTVAIHRNLVDDLEGVKTLYVITDVVLASYVKLLVRIGNQTANFIYDRDMPIGFKYKKYRLRNDGTFVAEIPTSLKVQEHEAIWLQPLPQPIPTVPTWDYMRRQYRGGMLRKMRSNLTIPTLNETPERIRRREIEAEEIQPNQQINRLNENDDNQVRGAMRVQNFLRGNWSIPNLLPNQPVAARRSVSMEAVRGSDDEEE